ncbi:peptidase M23 [Flavobacterium akiainvivens]|uniref:Peptidase M23 n=1 Tax=Flavobacterium akiainvivens TaxID=1202724 RepID=A0A0M8MK21_9FLAO|nr:peptidoglycan DD-metalloendopeptidase family protein [Flavobacterium akiainvivens]KOS07128.1 peptidase M23 [Flavobacterium akiainvivens]SFQ75899.1 Septal ring factor EnvC, activator of murein hydrolases AmiA and AmiB [Flavobacterium akiainvivens]
MKKLLLTILFMLTGALLMAQTAEQKKLEQRKAQILKEIKDLNSLINKEDKKEKSALSQISESEAKIKLSEKLISTTNRQTRLLTDEIYLNQLKINKLKRELVVLKEDYSKTLVKAYKSRNEQSRIMFILSSKNFLEAYRRIQYMKQYASFRKIQGDEIRTKMAELEKTIATLEGQKKEKVKLVAQSEKDKDALEKDKKEQQSLVKTIQKDRKKLNAEVVKKQKESREVQQKIDAAIREAIAAANKKTAKSTTESKTTTAAASTASPNKIVLTKEGKLISDNFKANKGKLSYPVAHGYISLPYGDTPHPFVKGYTQHNSGVEITTNPGEAVRAVFGGEVSQIQMTPDTKKKIVYIRHGDYFTVYYNMESVNVSPGQEVSAMQSIGTVATNPVTKESVLKFCILQNTSYLNPSSWIVK